MKIMFVCHGNICRSPSAELIFKKLINKSGLEDVYLCASSATSDEEIGFDGTGNAVYPPMASVLASHGISPDGKRAVQLTCADAEKYDLFVGMDEANIRNMRRILGVRAYDKIVKLNSTDVFDPWYSRDFERAYREIYDGCVKLLSSLEDKRKNNEI